MKNTSTSTAVFDVPVAKLMKLCNPFKNNPWGCPVFSFDEVQKAINERRKEPDSQSTDHAARVAYLVGQKQEKPITVDVGVPAVGNYVAWPVTDGNHRLAAAIFFQSFMQSGYLKNRFLRSRLATWR